MGIRLTLAFAIYLLYSIKSFECLVESDQIALHAEQKSDTAEGDWQADSASASATLVRAKRHTSQSRVSLIEPQSAQKTHVDALSRRSQPNDRGFLASGYEYDNQTDPPSQGSNGDSTSTTTEAAAQGDDAAESEDDDNDIVSPLVVYLIVAGIVLMMIALLVISAAILHIICTIPANDKDDEDGCATSNGNARSSPRTPASASFSRCPSLPPKADDRTYSEQSVDLVHKSRGSSLSRQSSCRICPRFAPKSSRGRASCASTGTTSSSSGGSDDAAAVAATTAGKKDYFVSCVCDLPAEEEYSPSASTTTTFGRC